MIAAVSALVLSTVLIALSATVLRAGFIHLFSEPEDLRREVNL